MTLPTQPSTAEEVRGTTDASVGELLSRVTDDVNQLLRSHLELAKVEIKEEIAKAGKGAGMLTGAALAGYLTVTLLSFAAAWGLSEVVPEGVGFLIVGLVWAVVTGVLVMTGRRELQEVRPVPQTKETIEEDVQWAKEQRA